MNKFSFAKTIKAIISGDWSKAKYEKKVMNEAKKEAKRNAKKGGAVYSLISDVPIGFIIKGKFVKNKNSW